MIADIGFQLDFFSLQFKRYAMLYLQLTRLETETKYYISMFVTILRGRYVIWRNIEKIYETEGELS